MKAKFLPAAQVDRWLLVSVVVLLTALIVGLGGLVAACGGTETTTTSRERDLDHAGRNHH